MTTFEMPLKTPSLNDWYSSKHWTKRKALKDLWLTEVRVAISEYKIKKIKKFPIKITTQSHFKSNTKRDVDNLITANKLITDGLKHYNIIPDDHSGFICEHKVIAPIYGKDDKVVIWIENVD